MYSGKLIFLLGGIMLLLAVPEARAQELPREMMVTNRYANIRKGPGTGYELVTTLYRGDRITADRKYRNWLRVNLPDGALGWVRDDLVGPYSYEDRPLSDEEADSVKNLIESQAEIITAMEDSSNAILSGIQAMEDRRDSLLNVMGLARVPDPDTLMEGEDEDSLEMAMQQRTARRRMEGEQASLLSAAGSYDGRSFFSPRAGVLVFDGESSAAAGFNAGVRFTREFSWWGGVTFSSLNPPDIEGTGGGVTHTFVDGGLAYHLFPGGMAVPYMELGAGGAHIQRGLDSETSLDLVFGAGCRMFLTADLSFDFGYRGHTVINEGSDLISSAYIGAGMHLPVFDAPLLPEAGKFYLSPYAGYQMFSSGFGIDGAGVGGMRAGYRLLDMLTLEASGGWLPLEISQEPFETSLDAAEVMVQGLFYPGGGDSGFFLHTGGGTLIFTGGGRPPTDTDRYSFFSYGAGVRLDLARGVSLRSDLAHKVFPDVANLLSPEHEIGSSSSLGLTTGINVGF